MNTDEFRDAMARWPSGVTIVACRTDDRIVATTVSAFTSLSLHPPMVLVALSPNATVLPFLSPGTDFGVSVLAATQRRIASVFADPFPVGPSPFGQHRHPIIDDALVGFACTVTETATGGDHRLVFATVREVPVISDDLPLIRYRRAYHSLDTSGSRF
jgi:flavin reductase (NADH)